MSDSYNFEQMLSGGHPNSLGNTVEVVEIVLGDRALLENLYTCYFSQDEVVRLRTSNAMKRICQKQPQWLVAYIDRFLTEVSQIEQPSAQWTLAQLFARLDRYISEQQLERAKVILKHNLTNYSDWIVLNTTIETLGKWSKQDTDLSIWLKPYLEELSSDRRKSVAGRAKKIIKLLYSIKNYKEVF